MKRARVYKARTQWQASQTAVDFQEFALESAAYLESDEFRACTDGHWFCADEETREFAMASLVVLSYEPDDAEIGRMYRQYKAALTQALAMCASCATAYQRQQGPLYDQLLEKLGLPRESVQAFFMKLHTFDRERLEEQLSSLVLMENNYKAITIILTEIFNSQACMGGGALLGALKRTGLPALRVPEIVSQLPDLAPGYLAILFSSDASLHQIGKEKLQQHAEQLVAQWTPLYTAVYRNSLSRNAGALHAADMAWHNCALVLRWLRAPAYGSPEDLEKVQAQVLNDVAVETTKKLALLDDKESPLVATVGIHTLLTTMFSPRTILERSALIPIPERLRAVVHYACRIVSVDSYQSFLGKNEAASYDVDYRQATMINAINWIYEELPAVMPLSEGTSASYIQAHGFVIDLCAISLVYSGPPRVVGPLLLPQQDVETTSLHSLSLLQSSDMMLAAGGYEIITKNAGFVAHILPDTAAGAGIVSSVTSWGLRQNFNQKVTLWDRLQSRPDIFSRSRLVVALLKAYKAVAFAHPSDKKRQNDPPTPAEQSLCEFLNNIGESELSPRAILDSTVYTALVSMSCSGTPALSYAATTLINEKFGSNDAQSEEGGDSSESTDPDDHLWSPFSGIGRLLQEDPVMVVATASEILRDGVNGDVAVFFPTYPGILRHARLVVRALFDTRAGVNAQIRQKLNAHGLYIEMWRQSWLFIRLVVGHARDWAKNFSQTAVKDIIYGTLDYCLLLLDHFRLFEAELSGGATLPEDKPSWGAALALPAVGCVSEMKALFFLAFEDMLSKAHSIFVQMLGLMRSFKVAIPAEVLEQFKLLASRKSNSKLTDQQLEELLEATGEYSSDEVDRIMDEGRLSMQPAANAPNGTISVGTQHVGGLNTPHERQTRMTDWYSRTNVIPIPPPTAYRGGSVIPSAPPALTQMEQIRMRMANQSGSGHVVSGQSMAGQVKRAYQTRTVTPPQPKIHPARPAGFNERRAPRPTTSTRPAGESSEDEDEQEEGALNVLHRKAQSLGIAPPKLIPPTLRPPPRPTPSDRELEKRRMRARLTVDASGLHRVLLGWRWQDQGLYPHNFEKEKRSVPSKFTSVSEYISVMEPLLHLEAWQQILRSKDEPSPPFAVTVGRRVACDDFIDVYLSVDSAAWTKGHASDGDLLVIAYNTRDPSAETPNIPLGEDSNIVTSFARVKDGTVRMRGSNVDLELRLYDPKALLPYLSNRSVFSAMRVCSLTTVEREYCALRALEYYDLKNEVLGAEPAKLLQVGQIQPQNGLNRSQTAAVHQAVTAQGFSLIQGPPGTGKTKTILGIVGAYFSQGTAGRRLLVCAPSNAAVDEIVLRLRQGVQTSSGGQINLRIVRLGRPEAVNARVRDLSLEEQIAQSVVSRANNVDHSTREEHTRLLKERNVLRARLERSHDDGSDDEPLPQNAHEKLRTLNKLLHEKGLELDLQRKETERAKRQRDVDFRRAQHQILTDCQVVCSTLSGSAHSVLANVELAFPTVIIDEAAQSVELSALIPLKYGCKQCIMVGDPNQLPPTVISQQAARLKYDQSLFVRMFNQHSRDSVCMLDTQFRMHPDIAAFPSREFYGGKLLTGDGMDEKTARVWHEKRAFQPYCFYSVAGRQERSNTRSLANYSEAEVAVALVRELLRQFNSKFDFSGSIGVISPYKEQVRVLRNAFQKVFGQEIFEKIDFNTVDGFQGQEKDIIIMSCVRASTDVDGIGFLGDTRRMNVAVTRAKSSMWILGHPGSLKKNQVWNRLITDAKQRGSFAEIRKPREAYADAEHYHAQHSLPIASASSNPVPDVAARAAARSAASERSSGEHDIVGTGPLKRHAPEEPLSTSKANPTKRPATSKPVSEHLTTANEKSYKSISETSPETSPEISSDKTAKTALPSTTRSSGPIRSVTKTSGPLRSSRKTKSTIPARVLSSAPVSEIIAEHMRAPLTTGAHGTMQVPTTIQPESKSSPQLLSDNSKQQDAHDRLTSVKEQSSSSAQPLGSHDNDLNKSNGPLRIPTGPSGRGRVAGRELAPRNYAEISSSDNPRLSFIERSSQSRPEAIDERLREGYSPQSDTPLDSNHQGASNSHGNPISEYLKRRAISNESKTQTANAPGPPDARRSTKDPIGSGANSIPLGKSDRFHRPPPLQSVSQANDESKRQELREETKPQSAYGVELVPQDLVVRDPRLRFLASNDKLPSDVIGVKATDKEVGSTSANDESWSAVDSTSTAHSTSRLSDPDETVGQATPQRTRASVEESTVTAGLSRGNPAGDEPDDVGEPSLSSQVKISAGTPGSKGPPVDISNDLDGRTESMEAPKDHVATPLERKNVEQLGERGINENKANIISQDSHNNGQFDSSSDLSTKFPNDTHRIRESADNDENSHNDTTTENGDLNASDFDSEGEGQAPHWATYVKSHDSRNSSSSGNSSGLGYSPRQHPPRPPYRHRDGSSPSSFQAGRKPRWRSSRYDTYDHGNKRDPSSHSGQEAVISNDTRFSGRKPDLADRVGGDSLSTWHPRADSSRNKRRRGKKTHKFARVNK